MNGYLLRRNDWGEASCKWVLSGIEAAGITDVKIINKDQETVPAADWCIRWATTSSIPDNPKVINKAGAIHKVYAKGVFRQELSDAGLAPKTVVNQYPSDDMYPVIIRPYQHSKSDDLYIASTEAEVTEAVKEIKKETKDPNFYCSEFIDKDQEFRVFVVSGRVVSVSEKIPEDKTDASWGCVGSGVFNYVKWRNWPLDIARKACKAMEISGLDFGAVDVIMKDQIAYVLEINTGPDTGEYHGYQLGVGIARILETGLRDFIQPGSKNSPYSFVHPAISNSAIME